MSMVTAEAPLFYRLVDLISEGVAPDVILSLKATEAEAYRYRELSLKFQADIITNEERSELAKFEAVEHLMRIAKARALRAQGKGLPE